MHKVTLRQAAGLTGQLRSWAYNALDCIATREIADTLLPRLTPDQARHYAFERAAQVPAFAMTRRGVLIDEDACHDAVTALQQEKRTAVRKLAHSPEVLVLWDGLDKVTGDCKKSTRKDGRHTWEKGVPDSPARKCVNCKARRFTKSMFNANSTHQCAHLLYDLMSLAVQRNRDGGVTTDDDALQRLGRKYKRAMRLTSAILNIRGLVKQMGFLKSRRTPSGRFGSTFVVGQAWTDRWSSTKNPHSEGGNLQNVAERHRHIFIADPGMELCYADLKQAESNLVAHIAGDEAYIEAHKSGDVHTFVTRLIWPDMPWTGDLELDKPIAKQLPDWDPVPGHDFRFQAKRVQHGGNYGLTPYGIARIAHIPVIAATAAARAYHGAFPGIRGWQRWTAKKVANREALPLPLGFYVKLFGRPWDEHTVKQGLSLLPQGTVAHIINIAAWRVETNPELAELQLLAQVHDALMFQFPKGRYDLVRRAVALMTIPIRITDITGTTRTTIIEVEAACGQNWGHRSADNPLGIEEIEL